MHAEIRLIAFCASWAIWRRIIEPCFVGAPTPSSAEDTIVLNMDVARGPTLPEIATPSFECLELVCARSSDMQAIFSKHAINTGLN
jgi:hypothetical protein